VVKQKINNNKNKNQLAQGQKVPEVSPKVIRKQV